MKIFIILGCLVLLLGCSKERQNENFTVYQSGAEKVVLNDEGNHVFRSENMDFGSGENQSTEFPRNGEYSLKLDSVNKYGMTFRVFNVEPGEFFKASVWQKKEEKKGVLVAGLSGGSDFTIDSHGHGLYLEKDGWVQHALQFKTLTKVDTITFFIFVGGETAEAYFDDFKVERYRKQEDEEFDGLPLLQMTLPDSNKMIIDDYISRCINEESIPDEFKKYVKGSIVSEDLNNSVKIRLKGDWTDHLRTGIPSYRIKTGSDFSFLGLRSFSIQHPSTRNYMHEWFMHKLCDREGLLSTTYDFVEVEVNGQNEGVQALEEHFDKELIESRKRREGPILKIDETAFWKAGEWGRANNPNISLAYYQSTLITCFKEKRTRKSEGLFNQFKNGAILLELFKNYYDHPGELFDLDLLARYYALMDLGNIHHSLAWHNRRFYYNPVTAKLEHIGFDMIPMIRPMNSLLATTEFERVLSESSLEERLNFKLIKNKEFRKKYTRELKRLSSVEYLDMVFKELGIGVEGETPELALQSVYQGYEFDKAIYYEKAKLIREELLTLDERWDDFMEREEELPNVFGNNKYAQSESTFYMSDISVNPYLEKLEDTLYKVDLENYHFDSVMIVGYTLKSDKKVVVQLDDSLKLRGFTGARMVDTASFYVSNKPDKICFIPYNLPDSVKMKDVIKWKKPVGVHPRIELKNKFKEKSPYYEVRDDILVFKGEIVLDELVYVPKGIKIRLDEGTKVDFVNGGGLIFNDDVEMNGTAEEPIVFSSTDHTGMGITILNADHVKLNHVEVLNMNTLDYKGWTLTGALTIYESETVIDHLKIQDNLCEDGLNVIRSNFDIRNCEISGTSSDGFDADFCTGVFANSVFTNTGNDCIDFSGSVVTIKDILIGNSGDKGISAGEESTLTVYDIKIDGAITGLASKDGSLISGKNISVKNAEVGVALFKKKAVYSGSDISIEKVFYSGLGVLGLVEKGSTLVLGGVEHKGYQRYNIDKMYERFDKK